MRLMRIARVSMFVCLGIVVVSVGFLLLGKRPPSCPLTLTFLGYTPGSNGQVASFCMSNQSDKPVVYLTEGPSSPNYYYTVWSFTTQ